MKWSSLICQFWFFTKSTNWQTAPSLRMVSKLSGQLLGLGDSPQDPHLRPLRHQRDKACHTTVLAKRKCPRRTLFFEAYTGRLAASSLMCGASRFKFVLVRFSFAGGGRCPPCRNLAVFALLTPCGMCDIWGWHRLSRQRRKKNTQRFGGVGEKL